MTTLSNATGEGHQYVSNFVHVGVMLLPAASAPLSLVVNKKVPAADALPAVRSDVAIVKEVHSTWLPDVKIDPAEMMQAEHEFCVMLIAENEFDAAK